jgi:hypothetical protein
MTDAVQGRLFNPDNPPLAFPKVNPELDKIKASLNDAQRQRWEDQHKIRSRDHDVVYPS